MKVETAMVTEKERDTTTKRVSLFEQSSPPKGGLVLWYYVAMKLLKELSAWVPIAMSIAVIFILGGFMILSGPPVGEPDEGVAAHVFQLLMAGQVPIIALFALKWLPQRPREALQVLVLQFAAGIIAAVPVFIFQL
jgi:hypothetical protein